MPKKEANALAAAAAEHSSGSPGAGDYRPEIAPVLTYDGATITWKHTPPEDRATFAETIRSYAEAFRASYRVRTELGDSGNLQMRLDFKGASTATGRQRMKGDVFMLIGDTKWGGGGS